ncbi:unnamed protein product [Heterobilharzia americana]|nr:unnamed protein product [Heterobilharzia americana]
MDYLSSHRFVHRDLAARNVIILNDQLSCKITDLGLARDCYAADYYRLHPHSLMLPIRWMPLDSIIYGKFTIESDIWAFGVLMWEVWSGGMRPYSAFTDPEVLDLIRSRQLLSCPQHCSTNVYMFMTSCWNEEIERRPTFKDCLNQIQNWYSDTPVISSIYPNEQNCPGALNVNSYLTCHKEHLSKMCAPDSFDLFHQSVNTPTSNHNSSPENTVMKGKFGSMRQSVNTSTGTATPVTNLIPVTNLPSTSIGIQESRIDLCKSSSGLGIRLLPNTTTMYIPTLNSVS